MHKPESVPENETHKILGDFEIKIVHQVPARGQDLVIIKKRKNKQRRTFLFVDLAVPSDHRVKIEESKERQIIGSCLRTKKAVERKSDGDTNRNGRALKGPQRELEELKTGGRNEII